MSAAETKIFERLKVHLRKHGYTVVRTGPISYLVERWNMDWVLFTLEGVEEFLAQVRGGCHDL